MTARDAAAPPPAGGRYVVTLEGPDTRLVTEYASRAEAVLAIEREVDTLQATGATIAGDLTNGYVARWWERGQVVSMRLALSEGQRQPRKTIRQLRQTRGWTQRQMADQLGVHATVVSRWERGLAAPIWRYRRRLADLFGVKVAEIAFGPAEQPPQETSQHGMG